MSIINEALKKAEEIIQKNSTKETIKPDRKRNLKPHLLYIFIFIIILFLGYLIFVSINRKIQVPQTPETPKTVLISEEELKTNETAALGPAALPEKQNKPEKNFILNGIFFSDNDGYALVNNQIVRENDSVDGAKVEKVSANTVELNDEGQVITLSTNR
jgi:type II secretory pathway component PulC